MSQFKPTAAECNRLNEVWDKHYIDQIRPTDENVEYCNDILAVLDPKQKRAFKQLLFRRFWWSTRCDLAFDLTAIKLTPEQQESIVDLRDRLARVKKDIRADRRPENRAFRYVTVEKYKPYIELQSAFMRTLEEIVGQQNVGSLLGEKQVYDPEWKRPVIIPDGLTLAKAKQHRRELRPQK